MAQKLKLKTEHGKFRVRLHVIVLIIIILASIAVGLTAGQKGILGITGMAARNCISQQDFQFFLDDANLVREQYKECVSDLWNLQLSYKMTAAKAQKARDSTG